MFRLYFGAVKAIAHAVALRGSLVRLVVKRFDAPFGEHVLLRPRNHAYDGFFAAETVGRIVFDTVRSEIGEEVEVLGHERQLVAELEAASVPSADAELEAR